MYLLLKFLGMRSGTRTSSRRASCKPWRRGPTSTAISPAPSTCANSMTGRATTSRTCCSPATTGGWSAAPKTSKWWVGIKRPPPGWSCVWQTRSALPIQVAWTRRSRCLPCCWSLLGRSESLIWWTLNSLCRRTQVASTFPDSLLMCLVRLKFLGEIISNMSTSSILLSRT